MVHSVHCHRPTAEASGLMLPAVLLGLPCSAHVWPAIASDRREGDTDRQDCKQSKAKQQHAEGVAAEKGRPAGAKGRQLQMRLRVHLLRCKVSRPMGGFPCMPSPSTQDGLPQNKMLLGCHPSMHQGWHGPTLGISSCACCNAGRRSS